MEHTPYDICNSMVGAGTLHLLHKNAPHTEGGRYVTVMYNEEANYSRSNFHLRSAGIKQQPPCKTGYIWLRIRFRRSTESPRETAPTSGTHQAAEGQAYQLKEEFGCQTTRQVCWPGAVCVIRYHCKQEM
jgi:hypothetical protein